MKLVLKITLAAFIVLSIITFILLKFGGQIDSFYNKFTTPKVSSMIIGDSRALTGIRPDIIDEKMSEKGYSLPMLNYSFTIAQAPIGPLYRKSILKKLKPNTKNGLFIISLSPLMLLSDNDHDNYKNEFIEADLSPHNMDIVDMNPNYEYFIKNYNSFHFKAIFRENLVLQKNGWLQDNNLPKTKEDYEKRRDWWINSYNNFEKKYSFSEFRLASLDTLIKTLKNHGEVYLTRLPVDTLFLPVEERMCPNFDKLIDSVSVSNDIKYFNYKEKSDIYKTLDGAHLSKLYSNKFTKSICDSILKNQ